MTTIMNFIMQYDGMFEAIYTDMKWEGLLSTVYAQLGALRLSSTHHAVFDSKVDDFKISTSYNMIGLRVTLDLDLVASHSSTGYTHTLQLMSWQQVMEEKL